MTEVADLTGFPELMDGRLKTLHPLVHGGLLAIRENPSHEAAMLAHNIVPIDLLVVNLYPFETTVARGGSPEDCIENIDIGGPAMIRGAAKNHEDVAVVVDVGDYDALRTEMERHDGRTGLVFRRALAQKAYARTAAYDALIANHLADVAFEGTPRYRALGGTLAETLRYGENPHQSAAFYRTPRCSRPGVGTARLVQGKALSFNNIADADAAFELVARVRSPLARPRWRSSNTPIPVASARAKAWPRPIAGPCDAIPSRPSVASSPATGVIDHDVATELAKIFTEAIIAPEADDAASGDPGREEEPPPAPDGPIARPSGVGHSFGAASQADFSCRTATPPRWTTSTSGW